MQPLPPIPHPPTISLPWEPFELGSVTDLITLVIVASLTLGIALWQHVTSRRLERIAKKQGNIIEKQDRIMDEHLRRQAVLSVKLTSEKPFKGSPEFSVGVRNTGNKAVTLGFYWHIYLSPDYEREWTPDLKDATTVRSPIDGVVHLHLKGFVKAPLFVGRTMNLGYIRARANMDPKALAVRWFLVCEDGRFPEEEGTFATTLEHRKTK